MKKKKKKKKKPKCKKVIIYTPSTDVRQNNSLSPHSLLLYEKMQQNACD